MKLSFFVKNCAETSISMFLFAFSLTPKNLEQAQKSCLQAFQSLSSIAALAGISSSSFVRHRSSTFYTKFLDQRRFLQFLTPDNANRLFHASAKEKKRMESSVKKVGQNQQKKNIDCHPRKTKNASLALTYTFSPFKCNIRLKSFCKRPQTFPFTNDSRKKVKAFQ